MTKILVTSWLSRNAPSGVITHIRKLREFFAGDPEIDMTFVHLDDAPRRWHIMASILRRLIRFPGFFAPRYIELSFECYERAKMDFSRTVQIERLRSIYTKYNRQP